MQLNELVQVDDEEKGFIRFKGFKIGADEKEKAILLVKTSKKCVGRCILNLNLF